MLKLLSITITSLFISSFTYGEVVTKAEIQKLKTNFVSCMKDTKEKFGNDSVDHLVGKFQPQGESQRLDINFDVVRKYMAMLETDKYGEQELERLKDNEKTATYSLIKKLAEKKVRECSGVCFIRGFKYEKEKGCQLEGKTPIKCNDIKYGESVDCGGQLYHISEWPGSYCPSREREKGTRRYCAKLSNSDEIECTMYYSSNRVHSKKKFSKIAASSPEACEDVTSLNRPFPEIDDANSSNGSQVQREISSDR